MQTPRARDAVQYLITSLLILTPLFTFAEVRDFLWGSSLGFSYLTTPLFVKLIKDVSLIIIFLISAYNLRKEIHTLRGLFPVTFTVILAWVCISFLISCRTGMVQALAGLRWAGPFFLAFSLRGTVDRDIVTKAATAVALVFLLNAAVQLFEFIETRPLWQNGYFMRVASYTVFGMARLPGLFARPNTTGFFACVAAFLSYFYLKRSIVRTLVLCLTPVCIVLSGTATAVVVFMVCASLVFVFFVSGKKTGRIALIVTSVVLIVTLLCLSVITGRDAIFKSAERRAKMFLLSVGHIGVVSSEFGRGTNTFWSYQQAARQRSAGYIADSFISGVAVNTGIAGLAVFAFSLLIWTISVIRSRRKDALLFTLIYLFWSLTISITEAFPMSLIFAMMLAYFLPLLRENLDARESLEYNTHY